FEKKLLKLSVTDRRARRIIRWFTNNAEALKLDSQGRINIPDYLLEFAGIRKQVVIAGALNHLEVWSVENYERQNLDSDPSHIEGMEAIL
ncbi:division/cell wall cluster transcriptional repressor MraZ, partial [candidate division WOR-3 bacterium]|nr:division/cell wall cluster transcriptional repressor MraZ [candidate division WOR-3 bacterium]